MPKPSLPDDPIASIRVQRRRSPTRHRGGAWKVAYADFVTALMALFIVLWLMNSSQKVRQSVAGYFHDPRGYARKVNPAPANEALPVDMRRQIEQALARMPEFAKIRDHVQFSVTPEGLRIDLLETEQGMFFVTGSPLPTPAGERLLKVLASELSAMPNLLVVEGHTDARPFRNATPAAGYSNWELGADRANAARRLLHAYGVRPGQIAEVRGFADQRPFNEKDREDPRNRRVSLVVRF